MPRRRAQRWTGPLPPRVTSPPNNLEVFTPKNPPTARPPKISAPRESLLRPSRPPATSSAGQPLPLERASSGSSESAHAAQTLNETHARQPSEVRARRRSRRRPGFRRLISREVRNLAGGRCSRLAGRMRTPGEGAFAPCIVRDSGMDVYLNARTRRGAFGSTRSGASDKRRCGQCSRENIRHADMTCRAALVLGNRRTEDPAAVVPPRARPRAGRARPDAL